MSWSREPPKCRRCGRIITFVRTRNGKQMPCDSFSVWIVPYIRGNVFYKENGEQIRGYLAKRDSAGAVEAFAPHWGTCKDPQILKKPLHSREEERQKIRERIEKERAAEAAKEQRRQQREEKQKALREAQEAQMSIFGRNYE